MSLQNTPASERMHIGIFGKRNAGKSSVINAMTGQDLAIVSEQKGTTTDPVLKTMELLPLGPVVLIDTPGLDDEGSLGALRIQKAYQMLNKTDIALLVVDYTEGFGRENQKILAKIKAKNIPYLIVYNKADIKNGEGIITDEKSILISAKTKENIQELKEAVAGLVPGAKKEKPIVRDLLSPGDLVVLVIPVDSAAPKGRLILPQQQTIRDIMEAEAVSIVIKENRLPQTLASLAAKPAMVITDSQVFGQVSKDTPSDILLTSFSILFARYKGSLSSLLNGVRALDRLAEGAAVLISEGCTHHRQCDDIGTVKLPDWIQKFTGKKFVFTFTSGTEFPADLSVYDLVIHCGACMLNEREMKYRIQCAGDAGVPITNYGMCIAHINGILERSLLPFKDFIKSKCIWRKVMLEKSYYEKADAIIAVHGKKKNALIPIIQDIQNEYRYLPPQLLSYVADEIGINEAKAYSVATFYENFSFDPKGKYVIKVCDGTACHVRKSIPILDFLYNELGLSKSKHTTDDMLFTVETVSCLGACGLAPVLMVNEDVYPAMTPEKAGELLNKLRGEEA